MNKTNKIEVELPFSGFYHTSHSDQIEMATETVAGVTYHDANDEQRKTITDVQSKHWNELKKAYTKEYARRLSEEFDIELDASDIIVDSPRQYNYRTDRIFVEMRPDELARLRDETPNEILFDIVERDYTSRPGFSSHYSNDYGTPEWQQPVEELDVPQTQTIIEAYLHHVTDTGVDYHITRLEMLVDEFYLKAEDIVGDELAGIVNS